MSIQVKEFAFVFYPVTDIARARKFYEGLLGLKVGLQLEFAPGQWWIEYDVAGQALALSNAMPGKPASSLALEVADLNAALTAVKAAGYAVAQDVMEFPPCRMFIVRDADGNEITLHQRKPKNDGQEKI
ncbi:MAG TPA: VOC family protein [Candidatus Didemnitutus sp.]|nr:VOC family protein [Candidatus Didemnitutus sp.]